MDTRQELLKTWLIKQPSTSSYQLKPMQNDASFRRYFRVLTNTGSYVAMDAPPERENCVPFVAIAHALRHLGLQAPHIVASDLQQGFLLLSDFGDDLYLNVLNANNAEKLYGYALDALAILQSCRDVSGWTLPFFTANFMRQELTLFKEWFLQTYLQLTLSPQEEKNLAACFDFIVENIARQKQVFMHRDFHSANLLLLPNDQVGILDFQDAFIGPVTYDVVSLLRDCYISWPEQLVKKLALSYREKIQLTHISEEQFLQDMDMMSLQRHLKALLTFSRKFCRDHNSNYLQHIPRTMNYILQTASRYSECFFLQDFLRDKVTICAE